MLWLKPALFRVVLSVPSPRASLRQPKLRAFLCYHSRKEIGIGINHTKPKQKYGSLVRELQGFATPAHKKISTLPSHSSAQAPGSIFLWQPLHLPYQNREVGFPWCGYQGFTLIYLVMYKSLFRLHFFGWWLVAGVWPRPTFLLRFCRLGGVWEFRLRIFKFEFAFSELPF